MLCQIVQTHLYTSLVKKNFPSNSYTFRKLLEFILYPKLSRHWSLKIQKLTNSSSKISAIVN